MNDSYNLFTNVTTTCLEVVRSFHNQSNNTPINNQLVTTMSKQNTLNRKMIELVVQLLSVQYGPDFAKIRTFISDKLAGLQLDQDELLGIIYESFLSVWNLAAEEFDILRVNMTAMLLHCKDTNPELFSRFESETFDEVKFDSTRCKYNYPCIRLNVDGNIYQLVGGTSLHLILFYDEVMFNRFGHYKGEIELTHGEFAAIRTKTLFFPQVYIK